MVAAMSRFTGPLRLDFSTSAEGNLATLLEPLVWECDELGSGLVVVIPAGFASDGATVPRLMWSLLPPWGDRATRAAILHDFLLDQLDRGAAVAGVITRSDADRQFRLALLALDVVPWRAWACWAAVRLYSTLYNLTSRSLENGTH